MHHIKSKNVKRLVRTVAVSAIAMCSVLGVTKVSAADITSGSWCVYYNGPGSNDTKDSVLLTAYKEDIYSATCTTLNNKNLAVDFTGKNVYAAGDGVLVFTNKGTKKFKFRISGIGKNQYVTFKLMGYEPAIGLARGSAKLIG